MRNLKNEIKFLLTFSKLRNLKLNDKFVINDRKNILDCQKVEMLMKVISKPLFKI